MHKYEEIRAELVRRINDHTWPIDFVIPHEDNLATEFNVARGTIRQALSSLVDAGLLERKRRAGTRVARQRSHASTLRIAIVRHEIEQKGHEYSYKLLQASRETDHITPSTVDTPDAAILHIVCVHFADGTPYQLEDRQINLTAIPQARDADFSATSPNEWLIQQQPYSSVRTDLRAARPSARDIKHLDLGPEEPVFIIERETFLNKVWLTRVRMSHPSTTFRISTLTEDV